MSTIVSSHPETSIWSAPSAPLKLHSRAREAETACCAGVTITKSLACIEIPQCIYDSCIGLGLLSEDPIGFAAGDTNLYRMTGNHPNMATDPSGLAESWGSFLYYSGANFLKESGQGFKGLFWDGPGDMVHGIGTIVLHPIQTSQNLGNAAMHPIQTAKAIGSDYYEKSGTSNGRGKLGFDVFTTIATGGASNADKAAKVALVADKAADAAKIASRVSKAADKLKKFEIIVDRVTPESMAGMFEPILVGNFDDAGRFSASTLDNFPVKPLSGSAYNAENFTDVLSQWSRKNGYAHPDLPAYNGTTSGVLYPTNPVGPPFPLTSTPRQGSRFPYSQADGHVETNAARHMNDNGILEGTVYHNNPKGTCGNCDKYTPTYLDPGRVLRVIPPSNAVAPKPSWKPTPTIYRGNNNNPG